MDSSQSSFRSALGFCCLQIAIQINLLYSRLLCRRNNTLFAHILRNTSRLLCMQSPNEQISAHFACPNGQQQFYDSANNLSRKRLSIWRISYFKFIIDQWIHRRKVSSAKYFSHFAPIIERTSIVPHNQRCLESSRRIRAPINSDSLMNCRAPCGKFRD